MFYLYGIVHHAYDRLTFKGLDSAENKQEFRDLMLMLANKPLLYNHNHSLKIGRVVYATVHRPTNELAVFAQIDESLGWIAEKTRRDIMDGTMVHFSLGMFGAAQRLKTYNNEFAMNFVFPQEVSVVDDPGRGGTSILAFMDEEYIGIIPRGIKIPLYFKHNLVNPTMDQVEKFVASLSSVEMSDEQRKALENLGAQAKRGAEYGVMVEGKRQRLQEQTNELLGNKELFMKDFIEENELSEEQAMKVIASMQEIDVGKYPGFPTFMRCVARKAGVNGATAHAELDKQLQGMKTEFEAKDQQIKDLKAQLSDKETQTKAAAVIEATDTAKRWEETATGKKTPEDMDYLELREMEKVIMAQPLVKF